MMIHINIFKAEVELRRKCNFVDKKSEGLLG